MMKTLKNILPLIICCAGMTLAAQTAQPAAAPETTVAKTPLYDRVVKEFSAFPHRVPGSPEYYKAVDTMEAILKENGIDVKRQYYPTLVPQITRNEFTVDGKNVTIHPLAPNNAGLITTGEHPVDAPVVYIPKDELYKNYGRIDGKVVLLDWGENYYPRIFFTEGAKAVIFVGNDVASQWDVAKLQSQYNVSFPYFYISKEEAEKHNLLSATPGKERKGHLCVNTRWEQVQGINLWAEIKPENPQIFNLNRPEAIIIGARLDTFGSVPGMVTGDRQNANLGLFTETAVSLSRKKLPRSVFLVLYGSAFNAYDSLRYFYYPVHLRNAITEPLITDFADGFREEQADNEKKLDILNQPSPMIRADNELSPEDYTKMITNLIMSLVIVAGLMVIAFMLRDFRELEKASCVKRSVIGGVIILAGIVALIIFNTSYTTAPPADEQAQIDAKKAGLTAELKQLESRLAAEGLKDADRKELENKYNAAIEAYDELLKGAEDQLHYQVRILIRDVVIRNYNKMNYRIADINSELRKNKERVEKLTAEDAKANAKEIAELQARQKELETERKQLDVAKVKVSNMRKLINERSVSKPQDRALLREFVDQVKHNLSLRKVELDTAIEMADCWTEIATATRPYAVIASYYFDFSTDDEPFIFATRGYEGVHYMEEMSVSVYSKFFEQFRQKLPDLKLQKSKTPFFEESLKSATFTPDVMNTLSLVYLPSAASLPLKLSSFTLRNLPGDYDYDEIPGRRNYQLKWLIPAMDELMTLFAEAPEFSMSSLIKDSKMYDSSFNYYYKNGAPHGQIFTYLSADGKEVDGPAASATALVLQNEYDRIPPVCGFSLSAMGKINQIGYTSMPLLTGGGRWGKGVLNFHGFGLGHDEYGRINYISALGEFHKLFRAYGGTHIYAYAPLTSNFSGSLQLVNGFTDGKFRNFRTYARVATGEGYAFADRDMKAKLYFYNETFILGSSPEDPIGKGISIKPEDLLNLNVSRVAIDNTIMLNLQRLEKLHKRNIFNGVIEGYHDKAEQHQLDAKAALAAGDINLARAHEVFGQTLAVRAYRPLRDIINDLVQSVLILLILTIPFSFALERLLVGSTNIYKQMGWILGFFIATFLLLYFTHPAFALSQAPMIIFIAFFIIVMSVIVIYIVMNRFKGELLALQGMDTSAHRVNTENSMLLAAILIGVSSMRNRPVKTFLTILTVILLTFTIISFASFGSTEYVRPVYMGDGSGEVRIESFLPQHVDLLMPICQAVKDLYEDDYDVFYRSASYNSPFYMLPTYPLQSNIIYNPAANGEERSVQLEAVVGFEAGEIEHSAHLSKLMQKPAAIPAGTEKFPGVYISDLTAEKLNLKPGDVFYLRNLKVRLDGVFKAADLDAFTYLDNGKAVPPNFQSTANAEETGIFSIFNNAYVDASNFIWSSPDLSLLTDYETANRINGFINAVVLYPKKGKNPDIIKDATDIAEVTFGIVYSNTANGVHRHFMAPVFSASGVSNLIVPLLLGALIILSSLLGSIADREREIFTFSALGLSPKDVSILFFAESGVYAVIGGLGGYLLSQLTNAILIALAKRGVLEAPEMNFSSMTTVYTILIVMAIVLLSTIYPAIKAGRSASPDVARKWKMPPPDGNNLSFQFPFTVSRVDFGGILVFISEHFANHADSSLGSFAASNVRITHGDSKLTDGYMLSVDLTLAPFDLGVAEELSMYSAPSDIDGVDVVTVNILRKDGSMGAWLRGNRRFVDEIRNQFLLWRSLPVETVMHYRQLAAESLKGEAAEGERA